MTKKLTMAGIAIVAAFALAFVAVGHAGDAVACDKAAKTAKAAKADGQSCSKAATAKTASASSCSKSAAAKTASASSCSKSAAAKTASASSCSEATTAKTAMAGCCAGAAAKTASAGSCDKSAAVKTASKDCCEGMAAVAGYSKAGNKNCDTKACPASECDDKYAEALNKVVDKLPQGERSRVVLTGTIECAHCTYEAVETCQPLLKTADGKVYPMLHNQLIKRMKKSGAASVEVTSNVRNAHGVKYLDVKTFKAL